MNDDNKPIRIIQITPPLPCGATPDNPSEICGRLTTVAYAVAMPDDSVLYNVPLPGRWLIQPVCETCYKKIERLYQT